MRSVLFSDPDAFEFSFENCAPAIAALMAVAAMVPSIEHINDGPQTAPSKRIIDFLPAHGGRKSSAGPDVAECIGVAAIRVKCPHFDQWLIKLENLHW